MKCSCFFALAALALLAFTSIITAALVDGKLPASFDTAEAWNLKVERRIQFPADISQRSAYSRPAFSPDFRQLAYCVRERIDLLTSASKYTVAIRSVETWEVVKSFILPIQDFISGGLVDRFQNVVFSPDGKKLVVAPVRGFSPSPDANFLFIDVESAKLTGIRMEELATLPSLGRVSWPNLTNIYIMRGLGTEPLAIDLDNLRVFKLPAESNDPQGRGLQICRSTLYRIPEEVSTAKHDAAPLQRDLFVSSIQSPYSRVLEPKLRIPSADYNSWISWTPDLRYILFTPGDSFEEAPVFLKLGLRPTPQLDFEVNPAFLRSLTDNQRQQVKSMLTEGKRMWVTVSGRKINPLNDKLIGPDERDLRGYAFVTSLEPRLSLRYAYEFAPAEVGNVVAFVRIDDGWEWVNQVWGELAPVSGPVPSPSNTPNHIQGNETTQQTERPANVPAGDKNETLFKNHYQKAAALFTNDGSIKESLNELIEAEKLVPNTRIITTLREKINKHKPFIQASDTVTDKLLVSGALTRYAKTPALRLVDVSISSVDTEIDGQVISKRICNQLNRSGKVLASPLGVANANVTAQSNDPSQQSYFTLVGKILPATSRGTYSIELHLMRNKLSFWEWQQPVAR